MEKLFNLLVISDNEKNRKAFATAASQTNFILKIVDNFDSAINLFRTFHPHIILCEMSLAEADRGLFFKQVRNNIPQAIVNMLLNKNDKDLIFKAMSYGINNYLIMPMEYTDLFNHLRLCECVLKTRPKNETQSFVSEAKTFSITTNNSLTSLPTLIDDLLSQANPYFQKWNTELRIGLEELIVNAVEHGNLNISFEEKSQAISEGTFDALITKRQHDSRYRNKSVKIQFNQKPEYDEWLIKDEGNGFNPCEIATTITKADVKQLHGRGILISRCQFDEIEYSENGTKVRVRKYIPIEKK